MPADEVPFSALLRNVVDNRGKTCPTSDAGIPLIATNCVRNDLLYPSYEKVRFVAQETYSSWFRGHPQPGDILFVNKATPGRVCLVPDPVDFCIAQDMVAVRADETKVYPKYLFAVLRSPQAQERIARMHVGTLIPHFKKGDFDKLLLPVPARPVQEFIGDVYFDLSAKIELNRRMSETLESVARALFKSWFVDFDMSQGSKPQEWEYRPLGELVRLTRGTTYKSSLKDLPGPVLLGLGSIERNGGFRDDKLSTYGGDSPAHMVLGPGDLYVSLKDVTQSADLLGAVARVPPHVPRGRLTQDTVKLNFNDSTTSRHIVYRTLLSTEYREFCRAHATGTTNLGLPREDFLSYPIIEPAESIGLQFDAAMEGIEKRAALIGAESRTLAALRDALLPKLISGELRVRDAERFVAKNSRDSPRP